MTTWNDLAVEETETERALCDCCRGTTVTASGNLWESEAWVAWFRVTFGTSSNGHPAVISLYLGNWSDAALRSERWGLQIQWHEGGCALLDWSAADLSSITNFTPLGRSDVLGTSFASELWAMVDAIIMKDSRLKELNRDP